MMNKAKTTKILSLTLATLALVFVSGTVSGLFAQGGRDPFQKNPIYVKPGKTKPKSRAKGAGKGPAARGPYVVAAPAPEARINYFRQIRDAAATSGQPLPKPTSVILLDELSVTGIFRTPRGYAAIVKAVPINLSYTIYPGEKFFDGQLVAVEENRLIFRKVTKWSTGKFVSSVEDKPLRKYSDQQTIQGTAPTETYVREPQTAKNTGDKKDSDKDSSKPDPIISPLDEMNQKKAEKPEDSAKKSKAKGKKRSKVAKKN